jgi:uncharacterized membrane protein YfcA
MIEQVMAAMELFAPGVDISSVWEDKDARLPFVLMLAGAVLGAFAGARLKPKKDGEPKQAMIDEVNNDDAEDLD